MTTVSAAFSFAAVSVAMVKRSPAHSWLAKAAPASYPCHGLDEAHCPEGPGERATARANGSRDRPWHSRRIAPNRSRIRARRARSDRSAPSERSREDIDTRSRAERQSHAPPLLPAPAVGGG